MVTLVVEVDSEYKTKNKKIWQLKENQNQKKYLKSISQEVPRWMKLVEMCIELTDHGVQIHNCSRFILRMT